MSDQYEIVATGKYCDVLVARKAMKVIKKTNKKVEGRLLVLMDTMSEEGRNFFQKEQFVFEGRFSSGISGVSDMAVYAFKSWQLRVYGGLVLEGKKRSFYCPEAVIKKQNKADREVLERTAKKLGEIDGNRN